MLHNHHQHQHYDQWNDSDETLSMHTLSIHDGLDRDDEILTELRHHNQQLLQCMAHLQGQVSTEQFSILSQYMQRSMEAKDRLVESRCNAHKQLLAQSAHDNNSVEQQLGLLSDGMSMLTEIVSKVGTAPAHSAPEPEAITEVRECLPTRKPETPQKQRTNFKRQDRFMDAIMSTPTHEPVAKSQFSMDRSVTRDVHRAYTEWYHGIDGKMSVVAAERQGSSWRKANDEAKWFKRRLRLIRAIGWLKTRGVPESTAIQSVQQIIDRGNQPSSLYSLQKLLAKDPQYKTLQAIVDMYGRS